jgi:hypothetical protein
MHGETAQGFRRNTHDIRASGDALGKLMSGERGRSHDVTLLAAGLEHILDFDERLGARLSDCF